MTEDLILDRLPDVLEQRGDGRSSLYNDVQRGTWTPPVRAGRASTWPRHESQTLIAARMASATDEQLRAIVRALLEQRRAMMPRLEALSGVPARARHDLPAHAGQEATEV